MNTLSRRYALATALVLVAMGPASAQTYQWKDASGRTVISDTPPPQGMKDSRSVVTSPASAASGNTGAAKSVAEQNMEFKKRQQENQEKADKAEKEQAAAKEKAINCDNARRQLTALESGQRLSTFDDKGERRFIEDAERQKEIERTRKYVSETCK